MMGLFNQAAQKVYKPRAAADDDKVPDDTEPDDTSILSVPLSPLLSPFHPYYALPLAHHGGPS